MKENFIDVIDFVPKNEHFTYSLDLIPTEEDIKEMLGKVDINLITSAMKYFNGGAEPNEGVLHEVMRMWAISKFPFYVLFGRNLTYEKEVKFQVKDDKFYENLSNIFNTRVFKRNNGKNVVVDTSRFVLYQPIVKLFAHEVLKGNICPKNNSISSTIPDYKSGQKISKFFSRFFSDKDFDIEYSKLFQVKSNEEKMVISIHPMDYLTCSWNKNNWTSCYSPGGCHAEGLLEIIFDKATCVAYISHDNFRPFKYGNDEWNSKIIRSFIHISRYDSSFAIARCYPNVDNEEFYSAVKETMYHCIKEYFGIKNKPLNTLVVTQRMDGTSCFGEYQLTGARDNIRIHVNPNKRVVQTSSSIMFCDPIKYLCSFDDKMAIIDVGKDKSICLNCGKKVYKLRSRRFLCDNCC